MADATGYRQTEDAGSSSEVLRSIIFNKLPLLNSPGELVSNTLYYDAQNSSVHAAEQTNFFGRDRIAFNNKNLGSTPSIHIPNVFFTNTCFAIMELEYEAPKWKTSADPALSDTFYLPHGWGFHALLNIVYYLGSSSVANIQISGLANYLFHVASCETLGKKNAMLSGGGQFLSSANRDLEALRALGPSAPQSQLASPSKGAFVFRNRFNSTPKWDAGGVKWEQQDYLDPTLALAVVPIRLPFSSMCAIEKRLSFDTKLLQQPIQVTLSLKSGADLFDISSGALSAEGNLRNSFRNLSFQSFQQGLSDQSLSLRNELLANPRFSVGVPFQYLQDMQFNVIQSQGTASATPGISGKYFVNITSMLNADLTTIQFALTWDQDQKPASTQRFAPFKFIEMQDIELLLNGQRLHNYDNASYPYVYLANNLDQYWSSVISNPYMAISDTANARIVSQALPSPIYEINLSRLRAIPGEAHMMNTPRFTNQTMQLGFRVNLLRPNFDPPQWVKPAGSETYQSANPNLTLQTSYLYNAVFMVGQDGGQSKLVTA